MNFWRNKSLSSWAAFSIALLSLIFVAEYFGMRQLLRSLTAAEQKIDFARNAQVQNQQLALQVARYEGNEEQAAAIISLLDQQEYLLNTLRSGGRMDGKKIFIEPLSRLPGITFDNLLKNWKEYKAGVLVLVTGNETETDSLTHTTTRTTTDSTVVITVQATAGTTPTAKITAASQWLSMIRWYDRLIADLEGEVSGKENGILYGFLIFGLLNIIGLAVLLYLFRAHVLRPLAQVETNTSYQNHSTGLPDNEIGSVAIQINNTIDDLRDATEFVMAIGTGRLDIDYQSLDKNYDPGKNKLADSLIEMQSRLRAINEEEQKRQWANEGLAKFVDILRASHDDLNILGDKIIGALVQYTNSNQGGLYILNDEEGQQKYLELISLFAFETKKFEQRKIKLGEGILGQTFLEKETTYLTDLPDNYIRITSGLGDANPKSILMVPLKVDTQVYGIIELASFQSYLPHVIAFVEKLGESIASTLASVRAAQKNRQLIQQFQQQTEQMRAQEEEMRQNMEELQATQEEIARKEKSYIARIEELEAVSGNSSDAEIQELKEKLDRKTREYQSQLDSVTAELKQKPARGADWELADEVEKVLKINLEALRITKEVFDQKADR